MSFRWDYHAVCLIRIRLSRGHCASSVYCGTLDFSAPPQIIAIAISIIFSVIEYSYTSLSLRPVINQLGDIRAFSPNSDSADIRFSSISCVEYSTYTTQYDCPSNSVQSIKSCNRIFPLIILCSVHHPPPAFIHSSTNPIQSNSIQRSTTTALREALSIICTRPSGRRRDAANHVASRHASLTVQ